MEALRLRPDYPEPHNNLAILLQGKGDLDGAEVHYQETLSSGTTTLKHIITTRYCSNRRAIGQGRRSTSTWHTSWRQWSG